MSTPQSGSLKDLPELKKRAKELLRAFGEGDAEAVRTVRAHFHGAEPGQFRLAQAQLVLARSIGYASWARLREAAGAEYAERRPRTKPAELDSRYITAGTSVMWTQWTASRLGLCSRPAVTATHDRCAR